MEDVKEIRKFGMSNMFLLKGIFKKEISKFHRNIRAVQMSRRPVEGQKKKDIDRLEKSNFVIVGFLLRVYAS